MVVVVVDGDIREEWTLSYRADDLQAQLHDVVSE